MLMGHLHLQVCLGQMPNSKSSLTTIITLTCVICTSFNVCVKLEYVNTQLFHAGNIIEYLWVIFFPGAPRLNQFLGSQNYQVVPEEIDVCFDDVKGV